MIEEDLHFYVYLFYDLKLLTGNVILETIVPCYCFIYFHNISKFDNLFFGYTLKGFTRGYQGGAQGLRLRGYRGNRL